MTKSISSIERRKSWHLNRWKNKVVFLFVGAVIIRQIKYFLTTTPTSNLLRKEHHDETVAATYMHTVIAHVVSLIKCDQGHMVTGFLDAAAVLRHSIHRQSNFTGNSHYCYHMVAMVHPDCSTHAQPLAQLGYEIKVVPPPIRIDELPPGFYHDYVHRAKCCGIDEFIKLYAYNLTEFPITVHWDMDAMVLQPMDTLFDAMLFSKNSTRGRNARAQLELQHPKLPLPDMIDAFLTRDITSSEPWEEHQGVQGGFLVARPNPKHLETYLQIIKEANYSGGRGRGSGWGSMGYGGFQGAMAYQGVLAYFYDQYEPKYVGRA
jgi:hypothetical protein